MKKSIIIKLLICSVIVVTVATILFFVCGVWSDKSEQEVQPTEHSETKSKPELLDWITKEDQEGIVMPTLYSTADYTQTYKNDFYYLRSKGNNKYTIYKNKGQKVGTFLLEEVIDLDGFVKSGESFFVQYQRDGGERVNLSKINLQEKSTEPINSVYSFNEVPTDYFFNDSIYSVKVNEMPDKKVYEIECSNFDGIIEDEYNITFPNKKQNLYRIVKMTKEGVLFEEREKEKRTFYAYNFAKRKCERVTQLVFPDDKKLYDNAGEYEFEEDSLLAEFPISYSLSRLYSIDYKDNGIKLLFDKIRAFSCYGRYICYIDKDYAVHKYDRQTEKDVVLDNKFKAMSINCTSTGMWMREYDALCEDNEDIYISHADPLYFMDYAGNRTKIRGGK